MIYKISKNAHFKLTDQDGNIFCEGECEIPDDFCLKTNPNIKIVNFMIV